MKNALVILALLLPCAPAAHAEFFDGRSLLSGLNSKNSIQRFTAEGYILGIFDAGFSKAHCAPPHTRTRQVVNMVHEHLNSQPGLLWMSADQLVLAPLFKEWPCKKRPQFVA